MTHKCDNDYHVPNLIEVSPLGCEDISLATPAICVNMKETSKEHSSNGNSTCVQTVPPDESVD